MSAPTAPTAPTTNVHIVIPGFTALFEGAVNWSACGPVANEVAVAACERRAPSVALAKAVVARDLAAKRFADPGGQTLASINWDLTTQRGYHTSIDAYSDTPDLDKLHSVVKAGTLAGLPVIIEVAQAYNLPDNEAGVQYHFVVLGGIDSTLGYLVANGDTRTFISTRQTLMAAQQMRWAGWNTLVAAGIRGAITVYPKPAPPPPPPPPPAPVTPTPDYSAEIDALKAQVGALAAQIGQVQSHVASIEAGLKAL